MHNSFSDQDIACVIGSRIEARRLAMDISQSDIARNIGITRVTYKALVDGKATLVTLIAVLRFLDADNALEAFMNLMENHQPKSKRKRPRQRASQKDRVYLGFQYDENSHSC